MQKTSKITKTRFWAGVLYQENMREDWREAIGDIVQLPYAYCEHTADKDSKSEHRKDHVHIILAFPNTTTYNHAMGVFSLLSAEGRQALNTAQAVIGIRNCYDYLIHDTESAQKQGKELYPPEARITGNNFDIGSYEQLGIAEKNAIFIELSNAIKDNGYTNYMDFYEYVVETYEDMNYIEVMRSYSSHYERLTKANYQKWQQGHLECPSQAQTHFGHTENHTENEPICCPECGSISIKKNGVTLANTIRWRCKDCGKSFV